MYPTIRHRLTRALTAWHASDGSAKLLLAPWQAVFEPKDWDALLQRSILPKLAQVLQTVSFKQRAYKMLWPVTEKHNSIQICTVTVVSFQNRMLTTSTRVTFYCASLHGSGLQGRVPDIACVSACSTKSLDLFKHFCSEAHIHNLCLVCMIQHSVSIVTILKISLVLLLWLRSSSVQL